MDVETIKAAIEKLSESERRKLADWLEAVEQETWDAEMERDFSPGGPGQTLVEKIERDIADGKFAPLDDGLHSRQGRR
jgi:hypothetical protein